MAEPTIDQLIEMSNFRNTPNMAPGEIGQVLGKIIEQNQTARSVPRDSSSYIDPYLRNLRDKQVAAIKANDMKLLGQLNEEFQYWNNKRIKDIAAAAQKAPAQPVVKKAPANILPEFAAVK